MCIESMYFRAMRKAYRWDAEKNGKLISARGISFEMIAKAIEDGMILDIIDRPTRPNQQIYIVKINRNYLHYYSRPEKFFLLA
jgi:uncharacterized DUF497 family protein